MKNISIFGRLTNIQMLIHTFFRGKKVGKDDRGNVYYHGKPRRGTKRERRWVMYNGAPEASAVPPEWHGWLHHQTDVIPGRENIHRQDWQEPHKENLTGTKGCYVPPPLKGKALAASSSDYNAWQPPG